MYHTSKKKKKNLKKAMAKKYGKKKT